MKYLIFLSLRHKERDLSRQAATVAPIMRHGNAILFLFIYFKTISFTLDEYLNMKITLPV